VLGCSLLINVDIVIEIAVSLFGSQAWTSEGGDRPVVDFENSSKKGCFLSFEWEKTNFTTSAPP